MKKFNLTIVITLFFFCDFIQAQEDTTKSKFDIITYAGIGYGIIVDDTEPNYNVNTNYGEILINYKFKNNFGLATGIGYNQLTGTGFNSVGNFYHERKILKIPIIATFQYKFDDKFKVIANFGFYSQNIINYNYHFLTYSENASNIGWNFGSQLGLGFVYQLNKNIGFGINFNGQSDLTKLKTYSGESKIKNLNSLGLLFLFSL